MRVYTSHRRDAGLFEEPDLVLVKEGFCWPAFFFTPLWALWHGMWLTALLLFAAGVAIDTLDDVLHPLSAAALTLGLMTYAGAAANDWRRATLRRRGFVEGPVVAARDRGTAEWRLTQAEATGAPGIPASLETA